MRHKIVISDRYFRVVDEVQDRASDISWEYNRIGGCGLASFKVKERYGGRSVIALGYNVKIYRRNPSTQAYDLWYQGRIEDKINNVQRDPEIVEIKCNGYYSALADIYVDEDYTSQTVNQVVDDILTNHVAPNTDIIKGTIQDGTFTLDSLEVNQKAKSVIETLGETQGAMEWGVDASRTFFMRARSTTVGFRKNFGKDILDFKNDSTSKRIINRVIVIGGEVAGAPLQRIVDDTASQNKWGRRDEPIKNSNIITNAVADQFGQSKLDEFKDVVRRASCKILGDTQIESTVPIPLFQIRPRGIRYGERRYGEFLYSGLINYQIQRISYKLDDEGNLTTDLRLGELRPDLPEQISQIAFDIEQQQAQGV